MSVPRASVRRLLLAALLLTAACEPRLIQAYPDELAGIGVVVQVVAEGHVISRVVSGGPAETAGLHVGDRLLAIDGKTTDGRSLASIVESLRGREGSAVVLKVASSGQSDNQVTVTRKLLARNGHDYQAR